ncbi:MAG: hypothetical protein IT435_20310 [Phycisphaerales bacterium]|nr:hypothetical protein [Phycisphaerales bacterium]
MPIPPGGSTGEGGSGGAGSGGGGDPQNPENQNSPPPPDIDLNTSEEIDWRARALAAEEKVRQLEAQLADIKTTLADARQRLDDSERRAGIDRELTAAGVVDTEAATLLIERLLDEMDKPDVQAAVADLRQRKPFLFRPAAAGVRVSAMSGVAESGSTLDLLAAEARMSGDRKSLMKYLKARRRA